MRAAQPVKQNGAIIGAVAVGDSLPRNKFVDNISALTGMEVTVFDRDTRVSTTV